MSVLRAASCSAAILALTFTIGPSPALAIDCGVLAIIPVVCQNPSTQPLPTPYATAAPVTPAASPAVAPHGRTASTRTAPAPEAPTVASPSRSPAAVPLGDPQAVTTAGPAVMTPAETATPSTAATQEAKTLATATTAPTAEPPPTTMSLAPTGPKNDAQVSGREGKTLAGAWLLVLGGLLVAGAALAGLTAVTPVRWPGERGQ